MNDVKVGQRVRVLDFPEVVWEVVEMGHSTALAGMPEVRIRRLTDGHIIAVSVSALVPE